eukprot:5482795-Pyramimonas_sp.AAC.1
MAHMAGVGWPQKPTGYHLQQRCRGVTFVHELPIAPGEDRAYGLLVGEVHARGLQQAVYLAAPELTQGVQRVLRYYCDNQPPRKWHRPHDRALL